MLVAFHARASRDVLPPGSPFVSPVVNVHSAAESQGDLGFSYRGLQVQHQPVVPLRARLLHIAIWEGSKRRLIVVLRNRNKRPRPMPGFRFLGRGHAWTGGLLPAW